MLFIYPYIVYYSIGCHFTNYTLHKKSESIRNADHLICNRQSVINQEENQYKINVVLYESNLLNEQTCLQLNGSLVSVYDVTSAIRVKFRC